MKKQLSIQDCESSLIFALNTLKIRLALKTFLSIFLLISCLTVSSQAADGDLIWASEGNGGIPAIVSDGNGGAIVTQGRGVCFPVGFGLDIKRIDHSGAVTIWDSSGIGGGLRGSYVIGVESDSSRGLLVAWKDYSPTISGCTYYGAFITRFDATGSKLWNSIQLPSGSNPVSMCGDGTGGAYVLADTTILHYNPDGVITEQLDVVPPNEGSGIKILSDNRDYMEWSGGSIIHRPGGVYVLWRGSPEVGNYPLQAQWINAGKKWGEDGVRLAENVGLEGSTYAAYINAERNGNDGLLVSWHKSPQLRIQSLNNDGIKQWGSDGVVVMDQSYVGGVWPTSNNYQNTITLDGSGGAILAWRDWRNNTVPGSGDSDIYVRRIIRDDGVLFWDKDVLLAPNIIDGLAPGTQRSPAAVADGNGGALISYTDHFLSAGTRISLTRISGSGGKLFENFLPYINPYNAYNQDSPQIIFDGSGPTSTGVIIAWDWDGDWPGYEYDSAKVEIDNNPPANDDCINAELIGPGSYLGTLIRATNDGESSCDGNPKLPDVWYRFIAPFSGALSVTTCGTNDIGGVDSGLDTVLSVHQGACSATGDTQIACNDDWISGGGILCSDEDAGALNRDSSIILQVVQGETLLIRISTYLDHLSIPFKEFKLSVRYLDDDSDGDGVLDADDICPGFDDTLDSDDDGIPDGCDICPLFNNVSNPDCNNNLVPDNCDLDGLGGFEDFSGAGRQAYHLNGTAVLEKNACRLTQAVNSQMGTVVFDPVSAHPTDKFTLSFDYKIGGGDGADGMSFSLFDSTVYNNMINFTEEGPGAAALTVKFNTFLNSGETSDNFIAVLFNGAVLGSFPPTFDLNDNSWRHVEITFESPTLTMAITSPDGSRDIIFNALPISTFTPFVALYGFGSRTGGLTDEHWVDNILFKDTSQSNDTNGNNIPDDCESTVIKNADLDDDGDVDGMDLEMFCMDYQNNANASCPDGCLSDINGDNFVTPVDMMLFSNQYGKIIF